jgi:hypothetical protein
MPSKRPPEAVYGDILTAPCQRTTALPNSAHEVPTRLSGPLLPWLGISDERARMHKGATDDLVLGLIEEQEVRREEP